MQRARQLFSVLVLVSALGCRQSQPRAVFVDVDRILAREAPFQPAEIELPSPPKGLGPESMVLNPMSGRTLVDRSHGQLEEARRVLEEDRRRAQRTLEQRLRTIYVTDVDAKSQDEIAAVKAKESGLIDEAFAQLREIFEDYAEKRGQLDVRLELLTNPQRHRFDYHPPEPGSEQLRKEQEEIQSVRTQISVLDAAYDAQAEAILSEARDTIDRELTQLRARIEERKGAAGERAKNEAAKQVRESRSGLDSAIGKSSSLHVPAAPGRKVTAAGTAPPAAAPPVSVRGLMESPAERRVLVEQQLEIWLKINGWRRAASAKDGRDATEEFDRWRGTYKAGR